MEPTVKLLLFLAALLTISSTGDSAKRCSDCGSTSVPYPLSTDPSCGDQSYKIRCDAGSLTFHSLNNTYSITSVDPSNQRLVIQPSPLLPDTCVASDIIHGGVQLNSSLPFNVTSGNTILFFNCTEALLESPLNCSSTSLCHTYINSSRGVSACGGTSLCCTFTTGGSATSYMITVRDSVCSAYTSFVDLDPGLAVNRWPQPGLAIQWVLPEEPKCGAQSDCDGNATCLADPALAGIRRCFCNSGLVWNPAAGVCSENNTCQDPDGCGGSTNRTPLIAGLTAGIGSAIVAGVILMVLYRRHRRMKEAQERLVKEREEILNANGGRAAKIFSGKEIKKATHSFSRDRLLGSGGFGDVYKGVLSDGTVVAIKCAKLGNAKGTDQVLNEVRILCQVNHRNLVRLLGCCTELEQPIMVYEYIPNGTLLDHLKGLLPGGRGVLNWISRLTIARDTAEGLAYLHFSAVPPIYHRDVKSSNILLDEKMNAKVSDFGLSRLAQTDLSHISTCAQGTLGYLDPEYYRNYQLTDKSDVYSFGIVLLELLTAQKAIDFNREADDVNLAAYVQRLVDEERLTDAIDPMLKEGATDVELDTMKALGFLAVGCLEEKRQNRPSMKEVTEEIEYIISIAASKVVPFES